MKIDIISLFPSMFEGPLNSSLIGKAKEKGLLNVEIINLRDYSDDKHKTADDSPYGGGPGMVMKADLVFKALEKCKVEKSKTILLSPTGMTLNHEKIKKLSQEKHLIFICGHYEGIDDRIKSQVDEEISIGDYVLMGGEIAAMVVIEAMARFIPGVIGDTQSVENDSFYNGLLDFPHYTRPETIDNQSIPEVLKSGNHKQIEHWRRKQAIKSTFLKRPDLLAKVELSDADKEILKEVVLGQ